MYYSNSGYGSNGIGGGASHKGGGAGAGEHLGGDGVVIVSYLENSDIIVSVVGESSIISANGFQIVSFANTDQRSEKSIVFASPCRKGNFFNSSGVCEKCPMGTYQDIDGAAYCKKCPAGEVSNRVGSASCVQCRAGTYSLTEGQKLCELCPENTYSSDFGSPYDSCQPCEQGYGSPSGSPICCPAGMYLYRGDISHPFCEPCPVNTYGPAGGSCTSCPAGRYSRQIGGTSEDSCIGCGRNEYLRGGDNYECTPCPVGSIPASINATTCKSCPAGQSATLWDSECSDCPAGKYSDSGGPCLPCPAGKFSKAGNATCTTCEADTFSSEGSSECNSCSS